MTTDEVAGAVVELGVPVMAPVALTGVHTPHSSGHISRNVFTLQLGAMLLTHNELSFRAQGAGRVAEEHTLVSSHLLISCVSMQLASRGSHTVHSSPTVLPPHPQGWRVVLVLVLVLVSVAATVAVASVVAAGVVEAVALHAPHVRGHDLSTNNSSQAAALA